MTDTKQPSLGPVSLPARAFDYDKLRDALEPAAAEQDPAARDQLVQDAIAHSTTGKIVAHDPRHIDGDKFKTVTRHLNDDVTVTEHVQVFDSAAAEEAAAQAEQPAAPEGESAAEKPGTATTTSKSGAAPRGSASSKE